MNAKRIRIESTKSCIFVHRALVRDRRNAGLHRCLILSVAVGIGNARYIFPLGTSNRSFRYIATHTRAPSCTNREKNSSVITFFIMQKEAFHFIRILYLGMYFSHTNIQGNGWINIWPEKWTTKWYLLMHYLNKWCFLEFACTAGFLIKQYIILPRTPYF